MTSQNLALATLKDKLKEAGYSVTKPRQEVFELLQNEAPLTMRDLYFQISKTTDRTTVYRVIELFERLGVAQKVNHGWKYTIELTDEFTPHHHHFNCSGCGEIIIFDEPVMFDAMLENISSEFDLQINNHSLELSGLCSKCKQS